MKTTTKMKLVRSHQLSLQLLLPSLCSHRAEYSLTLARLGKVDLQPPQFDLSKQVALIRLQTVLRS